MPVKLSYSSVNRYKACPNKFKYSKLYRSKKIPSVLPFGKAVEEGIMALLLGSSLQEALAVFEANWLTEDSFGDKRKIYGNTAVEYYTSDYDKNLIAGFMDQAMDLEATELTSKSNWQEAFEDIIDKHKKKKKTTAQEEAFFSKIMWNCCKVRGEIMIQSFHEQILPQVEEVVKIKGTPLVQKEVSFSNEEGDEIVGYSDVVLKLKKIDKPIIFDIKTSFARYSKHQIDSSEQLKIYSAALYEELNSRYAGYIVLVKKVKIAKSCSSCGHVREGLAKNCKQCKKGQYDKLSYSNDIQLVYKEFKENELEDVMEEYGKVAMAIKNNLFYKNASNCDQYNRKCDYYDLCWYHKKIEDIDYLEKKK